MRTKTIFLCAQILLLTACSAGLPGERSLGISVPEMESRDAREIEALLAGQTIRTTHLQRTQRGFFVRSTSINEIIYFGEDNISYAWLPGTGYVHQGPWKIKSYDMSADPAARAEREENREGHALCIKSDVYPSKRYFIIADKEWRCIWAQHLIQDIDERAEGDPFNLSSGAAPGVLVRSDFTFSRLYQSYGIRPPPNGPRKVSKL